MKKFTFLFVLVLLLSSCKDEYAVERSIVIDAPQNAVWEQVVYFNNWSNWSPWYAKDSTMQFTYEGEDGNVESSYSWTSEESGSGKMTNTGLTEGEELLYRTDFTEPWESNSDGYVRLSKTEDGKTEVKWGFTGVNKGITSLFLNMDKMVGPDFEEGLELLKEHTEKMNAEKPALTVEKTTFKGQDYVAIRAEIDITNIENFYATNYEKIMAQDVKMEGGFPSGLYYTWDMENMKTDLAAAIPVAKGTKAVEGTTLISIPKSNALLVNYYGNYENIGAAHELLETYMAENEIEYAGPAIEEYVTDPMTETDPNKWLTKVIYIVK